VTAVNVSDSSSLLISENVIYLNSHGVALERTTNTRVFHNNFLNNTVQASDTGTTNNVWDNGYPSGGNYWSDYTGVDNCSGPRQNICPHPDGIGDTPYVFNHNQDSYPLMQPVQTEINSENGGNS
jgi:parallel beta-helix repeat protein